METPVTFLCLLIAATVCETHLHFEKEEKIESPEGCELSDKLFTYFMNCTNLTMAMDTLMDTFYDGDIVIEYSSIINCSPESMPYNYLPYMQSNRNSLELTNCQPPPENGSFGDGWPELEFLKFESYGDIGSLKREHFSGLNNLWNLKLITNSSHVMPDDLLGGLPKLKYLEMRVFQVNKNIFTNLTALETLQITIDSSDSLTNFDMRSLKNVPSFKTLKLDSNSFTRLTKRFFEGCQNVESLHINNGNIDVIDTDAFESMTNLRNIKMADVDLTSLPAGLLSQNKKLEKVHILFSKNLQSLPSGLFSQLPNLRAIAIVCGLTSIPNDLIEGSTNLELLDLQFNELTSLPRDLLRNHSHLKEIRLHGNKFNWTSSTDLFDDKLPLTEVTFELKFSNH